MAWLAAGSSRQALHFAAQGMLAGACDVVIADLPGSPGEQVAADP